MFSDSVEGSLESRFQEGPAAPNGMESLVAVPVAEYRDLPAHDATAKALIDFMWGVWNGTFDVDILALCEQDMGNPLDTAFFWHKHLQDSTDAIGAKCRAFRAACTRGPVAPAAPEVPLVAGTSELSAGEQEELQNTQQMLNTPRRMSVPFVALPCVGGASGADFSKAQLENVWESM